MSWYSFQPYVSVDQRRRQAATAAKKLAREGRVLAPVQIEGRKIAKTYWGNAWCENLESYSDYANRLPRGRSYARNGSVIHLQIAHGKIEALVQGSELYTITIAVSPLKAAHWRQFKTKCAGKITNLLDLLQGRLSPEILTDIAARGSGLFPSPQEITLQCSCPDWAGMCKHAAAVLYGIGARLDAQPELFFTLRAVDMQDLITAASAEAAAAPATAAALDDASLSEIFGVEVETAVAAIAIPRPKSASATRGKPGRKKPSTTSKKGASKAAPSRKKAPGKKRANRAAAKVAKRPPAARRRR